MDSDNPLPLAADTALGDGSFIGEFVNYAGLAGLIASFFSIIYAYSRQLFALSRAGYFPRALSVTSGRRVPHIALIVPGVIGFLLAAITEDGARMIQIAVFGATVSYVLMLLSHIILRRKEPDLERPYTTPGGTLTSGIGLVLAIAAVIAVFFVDEKAAFITLGVYLAGGAVLRAVLAPPPRRAGARGGVRGARAGGVGARRVVTLDELKVLAQEGEVDTVVLAICDMQGRLMGKRLTARHFVEEVAEHGAEGCNYLLAVDVDMNTVEGYDMSSWSRGYGDFVLKPDLDTLRPLPWLPGTVMLMADVAWEDGSDVVASPRQILRRQLRRLEERGWSAVAGTELEFIVFRDTYEQAWHKAYRDLEPANLYNVDYSAAGHRARRAAAARDPQPHGGGGHAGRGLQGRVQPRPARDQLPLRPGAAQGRRARDLQERAPRRSPPSRAARSPTWRSSTSARAPRATSTSRCCRPATGRRSSPPTRRCSSGSSPASSRACAS